MFKLFHKKLNKKGFTLAELLIVVAIIAILVAIAIPIFTGALEKAEQAVINANIRAVRGAAVVEIFDKWDDSSLHLGYTGTSMTADNQAKAWDVYATVSPNGEITEMDIVPKESAATITTDTAKKNSTTGNYDVQVGIDDLTNVKNEHS